MKPLVLALALTLAQQTSRERVAWNRPFAPVTIAGNLHYVGVAGVSSFLFTTPAGHILLDGGLPESAPLIARNIQTLGFKLSDVKILLNSHAHFDHAGGLAELKRLTGARLFVHALDAPTMESGRIDFGPSADTPFPPARVDGLLTDGQSVTLGGTTLTLLHTPGHTRGCSTWLTTVEGQRVVLHGSTSVAGNPLVRNLRYPTIASDYRRSFERLAKTPCDIFLGMHGGFFGLERKARSGAWVDTGELARFNARSEADFRRAFLESAKPQP